MGGAEMTVEQAVLRVLIEHYPSVKNALIQTAHPEHQLSGLTRLRGLAAKGIVNYRFDFETNEYYILTPKEELVKALEALRQGKRYAGVQGTAGSHKPCPAGWSPATKINNPMPAARWELDPEEIRRFAESLK